MAREFIVKHATYNTKQRMKEIQFHMIIRHLQLFHKRSLRLAKDFEYYLDNIIENFCLMHDIKISVIAYAKSRVHHTHYKPDRVEVALATKYLEMPVRIATTLGKVSNRKMYEALEKYITEEGSYELLPKYDPEVILELEKFNKAYSLMFGHASQVSKITEEVYGNE